MDKVILCTEEELIPVADSMRYIEGTEDKMEFGVISTKLQEFGQEIERQAELIEEIEEALTGKVVTKNGVCNVHLILDGTESEIHFYGVGGFRGVESNYFYDQEGAAFYNDVKEFLYENISCGSLFFIYAYATVGGNETYEVSNGHEILEMGMETIKILNLENAIPGETIQFTIRGYKEYD